MKRASIEEKITQILSALFPDSEYKALVAAHAIIDVLIAEDVVKLNDLEGTDQSEILPEAHK